jgi:Fur family peroxide stress response transcriptional regulator
MEPSGKHFKKRTAILEYLRSTTAHPSAETVFTDLKQDIHDLSMGTVYRNLNLFRQQGLASVVATVRGVERFDANVAPHVHFICENCDSVLDLMEMDVPEVLKNQASTCCGGRATTCQLSFSGLCAQCLQQKRIGGEIA